MKIALIGATGYVGSTVLLEAQLRGHSVTAIARRPETVPVLERVVARRGDVPAQEGAAALLEGHDVVVSAVKFLRLPAAMLIAATKAAGVMRLVVVGGAGSLEVTAGGALVDAPDFPAEYRREALAGRVFLETLRAEAELAWTFLSPSALLLPGERTGVFRLGVDQLLVGADGQSRISTADFACALIDEVEQPKHVRKRFTVGY